MKTKSLIFSTAATASEQGPKVRRYDTLTIISATFLLVMAFTALFSPLVAPYPPDLQGDLLLDRYLPPSADHLLGTDKFGRDLFSRIIYGGRISLSIAFGAVFLAISIGVLYGSISAYYGGFIDTLMMRFLDLLLAFPAIFLFIAIAALFSVNIWQLVLMLSFSCWMEIARLVRAEALSIRRREFILAAEGMGFSQSRIIFRHLIPNCLTPVIAAIPLKVAEVILIESALSFLGLGIQPPTPSWGNMINDGREALMHAWWISTTPGLIIAATVMSLNVLGERFRRAFC